MLTTINEIVLSLIDIERGFNSIYFQITYIIQSAIGALSIISISLSYGYIYSETRRQIKRLHTQQLPQEEVQRIKKDRKAATTLAIILIVLVISYLPGIIIGSVITSSDTIVLRGFRCIIWSWAVTFAMLGSLCNPIVCCWRTKKLRRAFLEILHLRQPENTLSGTEMREFPRNQPEINPNTS